ncbi:malectin domain-containing carbohydrate-binding protein [Persicobacter psychrovividus]|uniref:HYR domain-containing protein n=1 Tax=Persicobacter psychrovividus TaxID=387638 RepID=A0ABN6LKV3_9BACT|nr:hypothetical protein PEPS_45170 [Persicobacter psychrovividus]
MKQNYNHNNFFMKLLTTGFLMLLFVLMANVTQAQRFSFVKYIPDCPLDANSQRITSNDPCSLPPLSDSQAANGYDGGWLAVDWRGITPDIIEVYKEGVLIPPSQYAAELICVDMKNIEDEFGDTFSIAIYDIQEEVEYGFKLIESATGKESEDNFLYRMPEPFAALAGTPNGTDPTCPGGSDGTINVGATGGTGQLTYTIMRNGNAVASNTSGNFTGLPAGDYSIQIMDGNDCVDPLGLTIELGNPAAVGNPTCPSPQQVCLSDNASPTLSDFYTIGGNQEVYLANNTNGTPLAGSYDMSSPGVYTFFVFNYEDRTPGAGGSQVRCYSGSCNFKVTVFGSVGASANPQMQMACNNDSSFDLFTTLQSGYTEGGTWTGTPTPNGSGSVDFSSQAAGNYNFTYTINNPCGNDVVVNVTVGVKEAPNAGQDGNATVCIEALPSNFDLFAQLNGSDITTGGTWTGNPTPSGNTVDLTGVAEGEYVFTYTVNGQSPCGSDNSKVTVKVTGAPNAGNPTDEALCYKGSNITFDLDNTNSGADAGVWTATNGGPAPNGNGEITISEAGSFTYQYTVAGGNGCADATANVTVNVDQGKNAGNNATLDLCVGDETSFTLIDLLGGNPDNGGKWTLNNSEVGDDTYARSFDNEADGTTLVFTYEIMQGQPCGASSAQLTVNIAQPSAPVAPAPVEICEGEPVILNAQGNNIVWYASATSTGQIATGNQVNLGVLGVGSGSRFIAINSNGCESERAEVKFTVKPSPAGPQVANQSICEGETATFTTMAQGAKWYDDATLTTPIETGSTFEASNYSAGEYTFYVTAEIDGCVSEAGSFKLTVNDKPAIVNIEDVKKCVEDQVTVNITGTDIASFSWTNDNTAIGLAASGNGNISFVAKNPGSTTIEANIEVTAVSAAGCESKETFKIIIEPKFASIGNFVWFDTDRDGIQDAGEAGVPGVKVLLLDENGVKLDSMNTDMNGFYQFTQLLPDNYQVKFDLSTLPADHVASPQNQGGNDALDSDADANGFTMVTALEINENDLSWDLGINVPAASLGDFVWNDTNGNGIQDPNETGVPHVIVKLKVKKDDGSYDVIAETVTDGNGAYNFANLEPGTTYSVLFDLSSLPAGFGATEANASANANDTKDSDADASTGGMTADIVLGPGEYNPNIDLGVKCIEPIIELHAMANICSSDAQAVALEADIIGDEDVTADMPIKWTTTGAGTFKNDESLITKYYPTAAELENGASIDFTFTAQGLCAEVVKMATVNIHPNPEVTLVSSMNPDCNGDANGSAQFTAMGGTSPYTYEWNGHMDDVTVMDNNGSFDFTAENLAGSIKYTLTVTDAKGCSASGDVTLKNPSKLELEIEETASILCFGDMTGELTAVINGGTYSEIHDDCIFLWTNVGTGETYGERVWSGLGAGTYWLQVLDENGCMASAVYKLKQPPLLEITNIETTDALCYGDSNGKAIITATGGTGDYTYAVAGMDFEGNDVIFAAQSSNAFTTLRAGSYTLTVEDENGCIAQQDFIIGQPDPLEITKIEVLDVTCPENLDGALTITVMGGTMPYEYSLDGQTYQSENIFDGLAKGDYTVYVKDANGCETQKDATIGVQPDVTDPEFTVKPANTMISCGDSELPDNTGMAEATDNCAGVTVSYEDMKARTGECPAFEIITRTWTATDAVGNTSTYVQTIEIKDDSKPYFSAFADHREINFGDSTDPIDGQIEAADDCSGVKHLCFEDGEWNYIDCNTAEFDRNWIAIDSCDNKFMKIQKVTVKGARPLSLTCPEDVNVYAEFGDDGSFVDFKAKVNTTNEGLRVTYSHRSGDFFPIGTTEVTVTATDACGNREECRFNVVVRPTPRENGPIYINANGSEQVTTRSGMVFDYDKYFRGGTGYTHRAKEIYGTDNDEIHRTERYGRNFRYAIPAERGQHYKVTLFFSENYHNAANKRKFSVALEGEEVLEDFDIFREAGGKCIGITREFKVYADDDYLNLAFYCGPNGIDNAKVDGICVMPIGDEEVGTYVNANGRSEYTTAEGYTFKRDGYFSGGSVYKVADATEIAATEDDALYVGERYGRDFSYRIPATAGKHYRVKLFFAEVYHREAGKRVFNVDIDGENKLNRYDIIAKAGGKNIATTETFDVMAQGDELKIRFYKGDNGVDMAKVSAICVMPIDGPAPVITSYYVNAHGTAPYLSDEGFEFSEDQYFYGGRTYYARGAQIDNSFDDELYRSERYGADFKYRIPARAGKTYKVKLFFAENYWQAEGKRSFNVEINGERKLTQFDIFKEAGGMNMAITKEYYVSTEGNKIDIRFFIDEHCADNAKVSAICVTEVDEMPADNSREFVPFAEAVKVYPNPTTDYFNLNVAVDTDDQFAVQLVDMAGVTHNINATSIEKLQDEVRVKVSNMNLGSGLYMVKYNHNGQDSALLKLMIK